MASSKTEGTFCALELAGIKLEPIITYYTPYPRSSFALKITRAAEKSQCVPYICMLQVWHDVTIQHQRPVNVYVTKS